MSALEYAKAKLFGPLGISDVFWSFDPQGISNGGWGLYLKPRDMAKIGYLTCTMGCGKVTNYSRPNGLTR